ncbi:MAG: hypothetical protein Cons2KO_20090 [Congregibacter sp.]
MLMATDDQPGGQRQRLVVLLLLAFFVSGIDGAVAHPSHSSFAELEWSENSLNVALKIVPEDLERALSLQAGENITLVDTPETRALLQRFLARTFRLLEERALADGATVRPRAAPLSLVGMQLDYRETWIFFSFAAQRAGNYRLENTVLMDLEPTQTNRVRQLWDLSAPTLVFTASEPQRSLAVEGK